jgi:hypothetical protein
MDLKGRKKKTGVILVQLRKSKMMSAYKKRRIIPDEAPYE